MVCLIIQMEHFVNDILFLLVEMKQIYFVLIILLNLTYQLMYILRLIQITKHSKVMCHVLYFKNIPPREQFMIVNHFNSDSSFAFFYFVNVFFLLSNFKIKYFSIFIRTINSFEQLLPNKYMKNNYD